MKKIALILATMYSCIVLTSCNFGLCSTNFTYDKAIIFVNGSYFVVDVAKWTDYGESVVQITTKDGTVILTSYHNCTLIKTGESDIFNVSS